MISGPPTRAKEWGNSTGLELVFDELLVLHVVGLLLLRAKRLAVSVFCKTTSASDLQQLPLGRSLVWSR